MKEDQYNVDNTLTYNHVAGDELSDQKNVSKHHPQSKTKTGSTILLFIFELILTASVIIFTMMEGMWPAIPYSYLIICLLTALFSSPGRCSLRTMVIFTVMETLICAGIIACRFYYPSFFISLSNHLLPCCCGAFVLTIGSGYIIYSVLNFHYYKKTCTVQVPGRVIRYRESKQSGGRGGRSVTVYCPEYEYFFNGKTFRNSDQRYHKFVNPSIDSIRTLYIDPENPDSFFEPKRTSALYRRKIFIGIAFVLMGIMMTYLFTMKV